MAYRLRYTIYDSEKKKKKKPIIFIAAPNRNESFHKNMGHLHRIIICIYNIHIHVFMFMLVVIASNDHMCHVSPFRWQQRQLHTICFFAAGTKKVNKENYLGNMLTRFETIERIRYLILEIECECKEIHSPIQALNGNLS